MTSVLSRLQLLSGSKIVILLFVLSLVACNKKTNDVFRDHQQVKTDKPKVRTKKDSPDIDIKDNNSSDTNTEDEDVVVVEDISEEDESESAPQIDIDAATEDLAGDAEIKKAQYRVAVLAPFKNNDPVTSSSDDRFLQYFGGMVIASEMLNREGHSMDIRIIDTHGKDINTVLESELAPDTDVIVGSYNNIRTVIKYGNEHNITVVSPWKSIKKPNSEYYVQLSPYKKEYYISMMKQVAKRHSEGEVYIVGRLNNAADNDMIKYFQNVARILWRSTNATPLNQILLTEGQLNGEDPVFLPAMEGNNKTVFLVPNLVGRDDNYVYNVLRRISLEKSLNNVDVYGMFRILNNPRVDFELYNTLDLKILTSRYINYDDDKVKNFRRVFLGKFGSLPKSYAYRGYDNFMWLGKSLTKHGVNFRYHANGNADRDFLQESYDIRAIQKREESKPRYFENSAIDLIEFRNGKFVRSK